MRESCMEIVGYLYERYFIEQGFANGNLLREEANLYFKYLDAIDNEERQTLYVKFDKKIH